MERSFGIGAVIVLVTTISSCGGGGGSGDSNAGDIAAAPAVKKVLLIGIDGCRPDALEKADTPNLDQLRAEGVYHGNTQVTDTTWSGSGWSCILHGVWRDKHGVANNAFTGKDYSTWPDLFTRIEQVDPALQTVRLTSWSLMYSEMTTGADTSLKLGSDVEMTDKAIEFLNSRDDDPDAMFVYFLDVDKTGHADGFHPTVPEYIQNIEDVDDQVGSILAALKNRPDYESEDWLIVVTSDHGGNYAGAYNGHGEDRPEDRTVFTIVSGPAVKNPGGTLYPQPSQVDVVPTLLTHLGIDPDPAWGLDGNVLGIAESAFVAPVTGYGTNLVANGDGEWDRGIGGMTPNALVKEWTDVHKATVITYGSGNYPTQNSPGPAARGKNFLAGGKTDLSSLVQRIDVSSLATAIDGAAGVNFTLSGYLGGYKNDGDSATVTARFLGGTRKAGFAAPDGKIYFFQGDQFWSYDPANDRVEDGYPKPVSGNWSGLENFQGGSENIDAILDRGNGKIVFFKGAEYIQYDWDTGQADAGYPKSIEGDWPGLENLRGGATNLDAAVNWGTGKFYLFKGNEYVRFDKDDWKADAGYPLRISDQTWNDLSVFSTGVECIVNWPTDSGRAYFFKQGSYVRYKKGSGVYNDSYPRKIDSDTWDGLEDWYIGPATAASIGPVTAADRSDQTGLLERIHAGTLPAGTRIVEIEVLFRKDTGSNNDGYADNISLVLTPGS
jgi:hypothetical protein